MATSRKRRACKVLGVSEDATTEEVKKAYRQLALRFHPDRNPGDDEAKTAFQRIQEAYAELSGRDNPGQSEALVFQCLFDAVKGTALNVLRNGREIKQTDMAALLKQELNAKLREVDETLKDLERTEVNFAELTKRFTGEQSELLKQVAQAHLEEIEKQREGPEKSREALQAALRVVSDCSFDFEKLTRPAALTGKDLRGWMVMNLNSSQ